MLAQNTKRIAELDNLFRKTYEDNVAGKLSDKRFEQLSAEYEREQADLEAQNAKLQTEISVFAADSENVNRFLELVSRYTNFDELTTPMLNEFISKICVHAPDKSSGHREQEVDVYLNYIGKFEVPQSLAEPTQEEREAEEAHKAKCEKQREYNRRWYAKHRAIADHKNKSEYHKFIRKGIIICCVSGAINGVVLGCLFSLFQSIDFNTGAQIVSNAGIAEIFKMRVPQFSLIGGCLGAILALLFNGLKKKKSVKGLSVMSLLKDLVIVFFGGGLWAVIASIITLIVAGGGGNDMLQMRLISGSILVFSGIVFIHRICKSIFD